MRSKFQKIIKLVFFSCVVCCYFSGQVVADDDPPPIDFLVTGQRLEAAMNAGNYYMIGYYQGMLAKQKWKEEQAHKMSNSSSGQSQDTSKEDDSIESVERCLQVNNVNMAFCRKQSQHRYSQRQSNCSRVIAMLDYLPVVGGQSYTKCVDDARAILEEDLANCQFDSEFKKAQCYD